jgi:hypothetical protein
MNIVIYKAVPYGHVKASDPKKFAEFSPFTRVDVYMMAVSNISGDSHLQRAY